MPTRSTYLIFVGGIERNLAYFRISVSKTDDIADRQFDTLEQRRLGGIAVAFSIQKQCSPETTNSSGGSRGFVGFRRTLSSAPPVTV